MKASSELRRDVARALLLALGVALSGCGLLQREGATKPAPAQPAPPAKPPAKVVDKGDPNQRFAAALDQYRKNQVQEAEQAFVALTRDFPQYSGPWTNLGILYAKSNRRDQAIGAMQRASALNPNNAVAFDWLGILYRQSGDLTRARQSYERALALQPDSVLAHYNLAVLLDAYLHQPSQALPHYKEYQRLAGKQDLKVMAWVAEIEAQAAPPPQAPPTSGPTP